MGNDFGLTHRGCQTHLAYVFIRKSVCLKRHDVDPIYGVIMKKVILSILVIVGVSVASLANADERIKFLGVEMFMPFEDAVAQLNSIGLVCDNALGMHNDSVMCWGMVRSQKTLKDELHPVALVTSWRGEVFNLTLNCVTYDFCNETYGPWALANQLKADGVIPSWTTILKREFYSASKSVRQEKKFAFELDTVRIRDTDTEAYAFYCHHQNKVDVCIFEHPKHYPPDLKAYLESVPDMEFRGPVLEMAVIGVSDIDWNPTKWKQIGNSHFN